MSFLSRGVSAGYLVLGIAYKNDEPIGNRCRQPGANINCYWDSRRNIILGQPFPYSAYSVTKSNSIVWRIYQFMQYIKNDCTECSTIVKSYILNFITPELPYLPPMFGTGIDWTKLIVSGHSQGAGHAVAIGYLFNTSRIVSLSGSTDFPISSYLWAEDFSSEKNTSAERFFGLVAYNEEASKIIVDNWNAVPYSSPGGAVDVPATGSSMYSYSHQLCSTLPNNCFFSHGSTGKDTRLSDEWTYMLNVDVSIPVDYLSPVKFCPLSPCNPIREMVILLVALILMGIVPVILIHVEQRFLFKIPEPAELAVGNDVIQQSTCCSRCYNNCDCSRLRRSPHRHFYMVQLACLLISWGLGFACFWLYISKNHWESYMDVIKIDVGIFVGVTLLGLLTVWRLKCTRRLLETTDKL